MRRQARAGAPPRGAAECTQSVMWHTATLQSRYLDRWWKVRCRAWPQRSAAAIRVAGCGKRDRDRRRLPLCDPAPTAVLLPTLAPKPPPYATHQPIGRAMQKEAATISARHCTRRASCLDERLPSAQSSARRKQAPGAQHRQNGTTPSTPASYHYWNSPPPPPSPNGIYMKPPPSLPPDAACALARAAHDCETIAIASRYLWCAAAHGESAKGNARAARNAHARGASARTRVLGRHNARAGRFSVDTGVGRACPCTWPCRSSRSHQAWGPDA